MAERKIIGGAVKLPEIFTIKEIIQPAKFKIVAPDKSEHELVVDIKIYNIDDFYKSIESFKQDVEYRGETKQEGEANGSR